MKEKESDEQAPAEGPAELKRTKALEGGFFRPRVQIADAIVTSGGDKQAPAEKPAESQLIAEYTGECPNCGAEVKMSARDVTREHERSVAGVNAMREMMYAQAECLKACQSFFEGATAVEVKLLTGEIENRRAHRDDYPF